MVDGWEHSTEHLLFYRSISHTHTSLYFVVPLAVNSQYTVRMEFICKCCLFVSCTFIKIGGQGNINAAVYVYTEPALKSSPLSKITLGQNSTLSTCNIELLLIFVFHEPVNAVSTQWSRHEGKVKDQHALFRPITGQVHSCHALLSRTCHSQLTLMNLSMLSKTTSGNNRSR